FTKTQWLFVPDLCSDNHSYIWINGKKTLIDHKGSYSDEAAYIMMAKVVKENSFKNYFHLHELEKYPEGLRSQIWRCTRQHPPLYLYYLSIFPNEICMRFGNFLLYMILFIFVYLISRKILPEKYAIITSVLYWAAPYFFLCEGLQVANDLLVSLFVAIAIYFILDYNRKTQLILSGLFITFALL
ncbi:glycosyltransferase family 39 protein, partial [bacterium]|nr:glycosyltransferase family 39 protein [bacterium]